MRVFKLDMAGRHRGIVAFLGMGLFMTGLLYGQGVVYRHPLYEFSFEASPSWNQVLHNYNGKVFEVTNPNHNMRISMSFVPGCKNARKHLRELSGQDGLICLQKPKDTILSRRKVVLMQGACVKEKEAYRRMLIGIPGNEGLYMMEISCPAECYLHHKAELNSILSSLRAKV